MAASSGRADAPIDEALFDRGFEFDFFQAVRLLNRLFPNRKAIGESARPSEEIVRFRTWHSLAFPASAIDYIIPGSEANSQSGMIVTFMALTGTQGILPLNYTERLLAANAAKHDALAQFLDLFHHRLISLFYRAWNKYRAPVLRELAALQQCPPDLFTHSLFDLIGLGTGGLRGRLHTPNEGLLLYAGLIAQRPFSASALCAVLRDRFAVAVRVDQFLGSWYQLEDEDRCHLTPDCERNQLGVGSFLGDKVWDQQARIRIRLGPLSLARFRDFLPGAESIMELAQLVRFLVGRALAFDVQLFLKAGDVPGLCLADGPADAPQLGWTTWLKTREFNYDAGDACFVYAA